MPIHTGQRAKFHEYLITNLRERQKQNPTACLRVRILPGETAELMMAKGYCRRGYGTLEEEGDGFVFVFYGDETPWN